MSEPVEPPEPPRRRRGVLIGLGVAGLVLAVGVPTVIVTTSRAPGPATAQPAASASASAQPTGAASPGPASSVNERLLWVKARIGEALDAQTTALLKGDLEGFLAPAGDRTVSAGLKLRYDNLRAMKVAEFRLGIEAISLDDKAAGGRGEWAVRLGFDHCFGAPGCKTDRLLVDSRWQDTDKGFRLVRLGTVRADEAGPHPWEVTALSAAVGARTVVATTKAYASKLRLVLPIAEAGAKVADKYVLGQRPGRYVIYIAGPKEWKVWLGGEDISWAAAFALPVTPERSDVVVNAENLDSPYLGESLRHEMGHVATLAGRDFRTGTANRWWLAEGIAEYIAEDGHTAAAYPSRFLVRRMIREGGLPGDLENLEPGADDPTWKVNAEYGLAYYVTRYIAETYGRRALLSFVEDVLRFALPEETVARTALHAEWSEVRTAAYAYTRKVAG